MNATLPQKKPIAPVPDAPETPAPSGLEITVPVRDEKSALGWFLARSEAAWAEFQALPMPGLKDENWRYSSSKKIELADHSPAAAPTAANTAAALAATEGLKERAARFVFVNDVLVDSDTTNLPTGVVCVTFADALREHSDVLKEHFMQREMTLGSAKFAALHLAHVKAGVVVIVPKGVAIEKPVEIFHWVVGDHAAIFPHTLIVTGDNAEVSVVDHYRSLEGEGGLSIAIADLVGGRGSKITYAACQELADDAQALHLSSIVAGRDSSVKSFQVQLGASFSRSESVSDLIGEGSRSDMLSVSLPIGEQIVDQRTLQNHKAPHASSDFNSTTATIAPSGRSSAEAYPPTASAARKGCVRHSARASGGKPFAAWMANGPRYFVGQSRVSITLAPMATSVAHGCVIVRAFTVSLLLNGESTWSRRRPTRRSRESCVFASASFVAAPRSNER